MYWRFERLFLDGLILNNDIMKIEGRDLHLGPELLLGLKLFL